MSWQGFATCYHQGRFIQHGTMTAPKSRPLDCIIKYLSIAVGLYVININTIQMPIPQCLRHNILNCNSAWRGHGRDFPAMANTRSCNASIHTFLIDNVDVIVHQLSQRTDDKSCNSICMNIAICGVIKCHAAALSRQKACSLLKRPKDVAEQKTAPDSSRCRWYQTGALLLHSLCRAMQGHQTRRGVDIECHTWTLHAEAERESIGVNTRCCTTSRHCRGNLSLVYPRPL
mmetsp:Transcript_61711/g.108086  ORF Transcript_61711/g.108086 Transcript_61711/m.108086 type:complete len:230 (+) Transcript_61711:1176-1865(+)